MSNRFYVTEEMFENGELTFNSLYGLNTMATGQSKITIKGELDDFTKSTLYRNYEHISEDLKVYPTITIYPSGYKLAGGMGGFYHPDKNHIEMVEHDYLISILSHEMRHAFQYIYFPDMFFATEYSSARGYLDCEIERDARGYAQDFCSARGYWEEAAFIRDEEEQMELVIKKKLSPRVLGIKEMYFKINPAVASVVPRNYHWGTINHAQKPVVSKKKGSFWNSLLNFVRIIVKSIVIIVLFLIALIILILSYT